MQCNSCSYGIIVVEDVTTVTRDMAADLGDPSLEGEVIKGKKEIQCPCCGGLYRICPNCS
jgi:DNA-directed RNA polymerase subunit RPC12/RpoP